MDWDTGNDSDVLLTVILPQPSADNAASIKVESPLLNENEMKAMRDSGRKITTLPTFWKVAEGPAGQSACFRLRCVT